MAYEGTIEERYRQQFGRIAGYLPVQRVCADDWQRSLARRGARLRAEGHELESPAVLAFARLLDEDGIARMYVTQMMEQVPPEHQGVETIEELLWALEIISTSAPSYNPNPDERVFFPMSALFTYMMMTPAGEAAFRYPPLNEAVRGVLREWCDFLDSADSRYVLNTGTFGWLSPSAYEYNKLDQFVIPDRDAPHWGWPSFNAYFHREIKPEARPIAGEGDPRVVVSANDGTVYRIAYDVERRDTFWIKGQPYSLADMLAGSEYLDRFVWGTVFQSFLSGADYHRYHAPIAGTVREARVIEGLLFSDDESAGYDPTAGTYSQGYETSVNNRGLVIIESPHERLGAVAVMPIGITEISSVTLHNQKTGKPLAVGDELDKGDEIGFFSYGGSSLALVFQPGAIEEFTVAPPCGANPDDGPTIQVNAQIARAAVD